MGKYKEQLKKNYQNIYIHQTIDVEEMEISEEAKNKFLTSFSFMKTFIDKIKESKLDIMIGGSSTLLATRYYELKKKFKPNDIDCYMLNISVAKISQFSDVVCSIAYELDVRQIIVVKPLTITWNLMFDDKPHKIQLNIVNYSSWIKIFFSYHCGIVCSGYLILKDKFVCYSDKFYNDKKFSSMTNVDCNSSLAYAYDKYYARGFTKYKICRPKNYQTYDFSYISSDTYSTEKTIHDTILKAVDNNSDIIFNGIYINNIGCFFGDDFIFLDSIYLCKRLLDYMKELRILSEDKYQEFINQFTIKPQLSEYLLSKHYVIKDCKHCLQKNQRFHLLNGYGDHYVIKYKRRRLIYFCNIKNKKLSKYEYMINFCNIDTDSPNIKSSRNI